MSEEADLQLGEKSRSKKKKNSVSLIMPSYIETDGMEVDPHSDFT